jgi:APA family basic amino acid/polyamine antiporter
MSTTKTLGVAACTAIVVGNMVGSGFYLSPSAMAPYGQLAILAWVVMGAGAICLGLVFAKLARIAPATGGPYAYIRLGYGDFTGFLIGWGYWISIWASLPVIALAFTGAVMDMFPGLQGRAVAATLTIGSMWAVVLVNLRGVGAAGLFSEITTYAKLIPFGAIAIVGLFWVDGANLTEFNPSGEPLMTAAAALAPLTMFAFMGMESATVPAGDIKDPARTIAFSTVLGISIAAVLYILGTVVVMGVVPREQLVGSLAPFSDAARIMWGDWAATVVSFAVILSAIGALNGWTLLMGQVPMAAAQDKLFPQVFGRLSSRGVPAAGMVISATFASVLVLTQALGSGGFAEVYKLILGIATMTAVIPYAFCAAATGLVAATVGGGKVPRVGVVELVAFVFSMFTLYGCGAEPVLYGLILLLLGIPVYVWQRRRA